VKRIIKRYLPDPHKIRNHKHLRFFGQRLHDPNLWHLNRRSVAGAFSVGLFSAFVPVPFQMVLGAAGAVIWRVNLPLSAGLVWLTNPITMPPVFYSCYKAGSWVLGRRPHEDVSFELSSEWIMGEFSVIWQPFLLGCFLMGSLCALAGNLVIRLLWRLHVLRYLQKRRRRRAVRSET
jgi:uncharacterized protein (DUF2062 family)